MRTLSVAEIDQVSGGVDAISVGGLSITGIDAGLALRNAMGALGASFAVGYGIGTMANAGYTAISGQSLGTDIYQTSQES
jgi:hypothetical protein